MNEPISVEVENEMLEELIIDIEKHIEVLNTVAGVVQDKEFVVVQRESIAAESVLTKLILFYTGCEKEVIKLELKIEELKVLKDAIYFNNTVFKNAVATEITEFEDYIDAVYNKALKENVNENIDI